MRTLRFPVGLEQDESIPGALARGIRDNVLERASIFFEDAGLARINVGRTQFMPAAEMELLAAYIGCKTDALISRSGSISGQSRRTTAISFGDMKLERSDLDLDRRRIGPVTLRAHPYHRGAWLSLLLPYCPISLERLVDRCVACDIRLSWKRCWGIGTCEHCRTPIEPSSEAPLPQSIAENYRYFAGLISSDRESREAAIRGLPEQVRELEPGSIVTTILRVGQTCRPDPVIGVRRESVSRLDPALLASIIDVGVAMLRSWPVSIWHWADVEFARCEGNLAKHHVIRERIRRLGDFIREDRAQARLVRSALPQEFESFVHSTSAGRFYTASTVSRLTNIPFDRLKLIRDQLEERRLPGVDRVRSQFNVERVDDFAKRYRTSLRFRQLTYRWKLPIYAFEQMACLGILPPEPDEAVRIARYGMCVQQESVDQLLADLKRMARSPRPPGGTSPIETAARQIGGREKPWGAIFDALRKGSLEFWLAPGTPSTRTIHVCFASLVPFHDIAFNEEEYSDFPFTVDVNGTEIEELLNVPYKYLPLLVEEGLLEISAESMSLASTKAGVLNLARQMVSPAELGYAMNSHPRPASRKAAALGIRRIGCGWSRSDLIERGIIR